MPITYDVATNRITVTGYAQYVPCTLNNIYLADKAGTLGLHDRNGITAIDGAPVNTDRALRPADYVMLGGTCNDLYIVIENWSGGMVNATVRVVGTDHCGAAVTEDVVVNGNGNFYLSKWFATVTSTQVIVWNGGGGDSFDYNLTQGQWGVSWNEGWHFRFNVHRIVIGDGSTTTWFTETYKTVTFPQMTGALPYRFTVKANAYFQLGRLTSEVDKATDRGVSISEEHTGTTFIFRAENGAKRFWIFGVKVVNVQGTACRSEIFNVDSGRIWNCDFVKNYFKPISNTDIYNSRIEGSSYCFSEITNTTMDRIELTKCLRCLFKGGTMTNSIAKASTWSTIIFTSNGNPDAYLIDTDFDRWELEWYASTTPIAYRQYTFNLQVIDKDNNGIGNAKVILKDKDGNVIFTVWTSDLPADKGEIAEQIVTYGTYEQPTGNVLQSLSPHTLEIYSPDYQSHSMKFTMDEPIDWRIKLKKKVT